MARLELALLRTAACGTGPCEAARWLLEQWGTDTLHVVCLLADCAVDRVVAVLCTRWVSRGLGGEPGPPWHMGTWVRVRGWSSGKAEPDAWAMRPELWWWWWWWHIPGAVPTASLARLDCT